MNKVSPNRQRRHTSWRLWKTDRIRICQKEEEPRLIPVGDHFSGVGACLACCHRCSGKASVPNKFYNHPDHVLVRQKSQQLADETTVPDNVISSCQIDKHDTSLLLCLKRILNALGKQNDLIYGRLSESKSSLFL